MQYPLDQPYKNENARFFGSTFLLHPQKTFKKRLKKAQSPRAYQEAVKEIFKRGVVCRFY
jgi:hypothetical protein